MRKTFINLGLPLIGLGILRLAAPQVVFSFAGLDSSFAILGIAVAAGVLLLTSPLWERIDFRPVFGIGALMLLVLTAICFNSPTLAGLRATYISGLDIFVSIESFIMLALASLERKTDALPVFTALAVSAQLLASKFHRDVPAHGHALHSPHYS